MVRYFLGFLINLCFAVVGNVVEGVGRAAAFVFDFIMSTASPPHMLAADGGPTLRLDIGGDAVARSVQNDIRHEARSRMRGSARNI